MTQTLLFFPSLGGPEILLIVLVIFLLFGAALGQSKKAFREGIEEGERDDVKKEPEKLA